MSATTSACASGHCHHRQPLRYRLLRPDIIDVPSCHLDLGGGEYCAPDDPRLELLDELGGIEVIQWGSGRS